MSLYTSHREDEPVPMQLDGTPELGVGLDRLSNSELRLMQNITLQQLHDTRGEESLLLLGRVWYRLEQERRRRASEVRELEQLYFARAN
ncbi:MAG: hypothetical protein ABI824_07790 [Acidobacteriota bacterium]